VRLPHGSPALRFPSAVSARQQEPFGLPVFRIADAGTGPRSSRKGDTMRARRRRLRRGTTERGLSLRRTTPIISYGSGFSGVVLVAVSGQALAQ
jgi:hypothetical protein